MVSVFDPFDRAFGTGDSSLKVFKWDYWTLICCDRAEGETTPAPVRDRAVYLLGQNMNKVEEDRSLDSILRHSQSLKQTRELVLTELSGAASDGDAVLKTPVQSG